MLGVPLTFSLLFGAKQTQKVKSSVEKEPSFAIMTVEIYFFKPRGLQSES